MTELAPIAILAGGRGTRLGDRARDRPKALVEIAGEPFLFHQLRLLASHGAERIVVCVGHLGERMVAAIGDGGQFGLDVRYSFDGADLAGTAGALRQALDLLGDTFLVLYGDTYLRIDYGAVQAAFESSGCPALMCVLHNEGRWGVSNAAYADGVVTAYDKYTPPRGAGWIDYGLGVLDADVLRRLEPREPDLARVYSRLAASGRLAGYEATDRFYEVGTPSAVEETDAFLSSRSARASKAVPDRLEARGSRRPGLLRNHREFPSAS
jgi:N-acetyl-alpha-D-muramate 1-phosphate uridylyltransferase